MHDDLLYLPAGELLSAFRARALSPVELLAAVTGRIEAVNSELNAVADRLDEQAMAQAREAERRYATGTARPLEGLPVAVKEEQPIGGQPLREGSLLLDGAVAEITHPLVERALAAGAVVHLRTTTPEFCAAGFTHSSLWGITRNPWNLAFSSGGSGAALASGMAVLATGSDIGGSIRIPASFDGVVGFKPPYGRVPAMPPYNLDHYCVDGPMARTVADCALLENVIAGQHPSDHVSLPAPPPVSTDPSDLGGLRIAASWDLGGYPVEEDVLGNARETADVLREAGAVVEEVPIPWSRQQVMRAAWAHYGAVFAPAIRSVLAGRTCGLTRYVQELLAAYADAGFYGASEAEAAIHAGLARIFSRFDARICPASGVAAFAAGEDYVDHPVLVDGRPSGASHHLEVPLTVPFNIASRCPVLSVPSGLARSGVPTGIQIVTRSYDDAMAFRIGLAAEAARPLYREVALRPEICR